MKMSKRKTALEVIRIEFAVHGVATEKSTRAYIENRISSNAYNEAVRSGLESFNRLKEQG